MHTSRKIRRMLATAVAAGALLGGTAGIASATSASAFLPPHTPAIEDFTIDPCVVILCGEDPPPFDPGGPDDITTPTTTPPPTDHPDEEPPTSKPPVKVNPDVVVATPNFTG